MKNLLTTVTLLCFIAALSGCFGGRGEDVAEPLAGADLPYTMYVDGEAVGVEIEPFELDGEIYLPAEETFKALGATGVTMDEETGTIFSMIMRDGEPVVVVTQIGNDKVFVDSEAIELDSEIIETDGKMMVTGELLSKALDIETELDSDGKVMLR